VSAGHLVVVICDRDHSSCTGSVMDGVHGSERVIKYGGRRSYSSVPEVNRGVYFMLIYLFFTFHGSKFGHNNHTEKATLTHKHNHKTCQNYTLL
jgi:hypothetical protein